MILLLAFSDPLVGRFSEVIPSWPSRPRSGKIEMKNLAPSSVGVDSMGQEEEEGEG
jgi:hypothetical protein